MRLMNKYEAIVADYVHLEMRRRCEHWPYSDASKYLEQLQQDEPLEGKNFVCVWVRDGKAFTKECDAATDFVDVPSDCETIFRHQIEETFYDATRPLIEV